jgi:hypothetical protein
MQIALLKSVSQISPPWPQKLPEKTGNPTNCAGLRANHGKLPSIVMAKQSTPITTERKTMLPPPNLVEREKKNHPLNHTCEIGSQGCQMVA